MKTEPKSLCRIRQTYKYNKSTILAVLLAAALLCGCAGPLQDSAPNGGISQGSSGGGAVASAAMGRYVEEQIPANYKSYYATDIFPVEEGIYLARNQGMDELLVGDGQEVKAQELLSQDFLSVAESKAMVSMSVAENGARIYEYVEGGQRKRYFMTSAGEHLEWDYYGDGPAVFWYGRDGYFYVSSLRGSAGAGYTTALCRVDVETGETEYLWDIPQAVINISVCGDYLFAGYNDGHDCGIMIYSISGREQLEEDKVLTEALQKYLEGSMNTERHPYLIAASQTGEGVYVLTREGLFRHVIYGTVMEQVIEGSLCSIGDISKLFTAMCVTEGGSGGMPVFWLAYDSGEAVRFVYNKEIPAVPDTLVRVYSLHNDNNVRQAVAGYQSRHPELYVRYETGMAEGDGQTEEDALKNLATQIATGDGPDVLVMDGLPYDSYVEKGILMDLSEMYARLAAEEEYFGNVADGFCREGKRYAIPAAFQFTVLMGEREMIEGIDDLEEFASLLEGLETEGTSTIGLLTEDRLLKAMAMVSGGWVNEKGELDREALNRFLSLCRRVYAADRAEMGREEVQEEIGLRANRLWYTRHGASVYDFMNGNDLYCRNTLSDSYCFYGNPLFMGSMGGDILTELNYLVSELAFLGKDYRVFSDGDTACMPVSMLAVNRASGVQAEAEAFLQYALCADFQKSVVMNGVPINKDALYEMEKSSLDHWPGHYSSMSWNYDGQREESVVLEIEWSSGEDLRKLNDLLDGIDRANVCDTMIYNTVMELGRQAVNGEKDVEETVDAIAEKVRIYLAE